MGYIIAEFLGLATDLLHPALKACLCIVAHPREFPVIAGIAIVAVGITSPALTIVFTKIFVTSMDSYPGTIFHVLALSMLFPIMVFAWIDLERKKWQPDQEELEMKQGNDSRPQNKP